MIFMGKLSTILSVAALAGIGYYVGKKVFEKKKAEEADRAEKIALGEMDESEIFVQESHSTPKEKIQKASLFAVGAIKTGTEKFKEGIDEIINNKRKDRCLQERNRQFKEHGKLHQHRPRRGRG